MWTKGVRSCMGRRIVVDSDVPRIPLARLSPSSRGAGRDGRSRTPIDIAKAEYRQRLRRTRVKAPGEESLSRTGYFAVFRINESVRTCPDSEPA